MIELLRFLYPLLHTRAHVCDIKNCICEPEMEINVMAVLTAPKESSHAEEQMVE